MKKAEVEKKLQDIKEKESQKQRKAPDTAIQNNYYHYNHYDINISLRELSALSNKNPELANEYLVLQQKQLDHAIETDDRILKLEEKEQEIRHLEQPYARKFYGRGQIFAFVTVIAGLATAAYCGSKGMTGIAIASIFSSLAVIGTQFINGKK